MRSSIAAPIVVEGRLWGAIGVGARQAEFPPDTEQRIAEFTDLVAMAIANADSRAELTASRARVVAASDQTRRRIERDLHDGTQQRLVSLALELRAAEATVSPDTPALVAQMAHVAAGLAEVVEELQEMSRGIHPAILSRGGLTPALKTLARRSAVPVDLHLGAEDRLPEAMEVALYYVVSEALTNAAKHARAETVSVTLDIDDRAVHLVVTDDGVGGADTTKGSGLIGLRDRVAALGGRIDITSAAGSGTSLGVVIPLETG
jgi:signal transduction histidine kinase